MLQAIDIAEDGSLSSLDILPEFRYTKPSEKFGSAVSLFRRWMTQFVYKEQGMKRIVCGLAALTFLLALTASGMAADKIKIEKLDDLPRHTYKIDMKAVDLIDNDAAVLKLAGELKKDLEDDLAKYDITDKSTLKDFYASLGTIAILEGKYDVYLDYLQKRKELEDKEPTRLTMGMPAVAMIKAKQGGNADFHAAYREELTKLVTPLPYDKVQDNIKGSKGGFEMMAKNMTIGSLQARVQPTLDSLAKTGAGASKDIAMGLVQSAFTMETFLPVKDDVVTVYADYLKSHEVVKKDIWADRDVTLTEKDGKKPVVVAIWDSGVDMDIYGPKNLAWTNPKEVANNNKDDDKDGFVDDVHGIAWSLHNEKETSLLFAVGDVTKERPVLQRRMKGLEDLGSNIDSPEAKEVKALMGSMPPDSMKPVFEGIGKYGNYCHGTHVAGIASRGNPFARLMAARITFDYHMIPEKPTKELAQSEAKASQETVNFFKKNGVRVVNMSWGGSLKSVEEALEANNAGGTPEERKVLAREIYQISRDGLFNALKSAPDVLFVISAGNSNSDVNFDEYYPSSFDLPNVLTVGAVDQAGDETSFSSFGKLDVAANGFEVESYVPGGEQMKLSGTSMSSPNVTNLAAKLFALNPKLTVKQVRELIINGSDERQSGTRSFKLINPKKSVELIASMK
jgi:subtilisin family serine protease